MKDKFSIIFIDTYNASSSIIAESYLRRLGRDTFNITSVGVFDKPIEENHELLFKSTLESLSELIMPIVGLRPFKHTDAYINKHYDYIITMSDEAKERCPMFLGSCKRLHWDLNIKLSINGKGEFDRVELRKKLRFLRQEITNKVNIFISSFSLVDINTTTI
jgi:arsenate reductase (thioredoxin)